MTRTNERRARKVELKEIPVKRQLQLLYPTDSERLQKRLLKLTPVGHNRGDGEDGRVC